MPEPGNDRLEQFFRKAAARADVPFNEDDWKKLEERLDASDAEKAAGGNDFTKQTAAIIIGAILLVSTGVWVGMSYNNASSENGLSELVAEAQNAAAETKRSSDMAPLQGDASSGEKAATSMQDQKSPGIASLPPAEKEVRERDGRTDDPGEQLKTIPDNVALLGHPASGDRSSQEAEGSLENVGAGKPDAPSILSLPDEKIYRDLIHRTNVRPERYKQKAVIDLPGAEEEKTREVVALVAEEEELASDQTRIMATPRLSLLLSFAPDFSGTSIIGQYSAPGSAFGAMVHYHLFDRWSVAAGVIQNKKQYTGDGEDYKPPKGYWKYYTNGIIPETVDGSCSILEFPLMIQYTLGAGAKSKWLIGAGTSSYLMQSEAYEYNFDQPNPGAKERWDSKGTSRFMFNMINFSIGYERQVLPGLMLGIEPYAKIPLEEIGWSNLRLFSTGASVTLRYIILRKGKPPLPAKLRAPDGS